MEAGTPVRRKPITSIERTRKLSILLRHQRHATVRNKFTNYLFIKQDTIYIWVLKKEKGSWVRVGLKTNSE